MYVIVQHQIQDPQVAFSRGERLIKGEGAPADVRALHFFPSRDGSAVTCLWESPSVAAVQAYVDDTLGDASDNLSYEVAVEQSFALQAVGISAEPAITA